ncbi:MAG: hypothetical protein JO125_02645 [Chloroflexi bacterium]|nr:hypothetical protein [Chloroflexota bacterium]
MKNDNKLKYIRPLQDRKIVYLAEEFHPTQKLLMRPSVVQVLQKINARLTSRSLLLAFFAIFWLLNGFDKFLDRYPFWFGAVHGVSLTDYFAHIHMPAQIALIILYSMGFLEMLLGMCFISSLLISRSLRLLLSQISLKASILMFCLYSIGDILFADRADMLEHGIYVTPIIISLAFFLWKDSR